MKNKIVVLILSFFLLCGSGLVALSLKITPLQVKKETFVFEYGQTIIPTDIRFYINANEKVLNEAQLNFNNVKNSIGIYEASVTYLNEEYKFYIKVVDTTNPVAKLKQVQFTFSPKTTINAIDLLESVEDSSDIEAYFEDDETLETSKIFNLVGSYVEHIIVIDSSDNKSSSLRVKIVITDQGGAPTLSGVENIVIPVGRYFNPMKGITAKSIDGTDLTDKIEIIRNDVDTSKPGIYEVIYTVTGKTGNVVQKTRRVTVE